MTEGMEDMTSTQLSLSYEPPKFDTLRELINHVVYSCGRQQKYVAAELGWSPSQLGHILSGVEGRTFPYWLVDHFLSDGQSRKERALAAVEALLPDLLRAVEEMKK